MPRPNATEFAPFYASYVARVPETDPIGRLKRSRPSFQRLPIGLRPRTNCSNAPRQMERASGVRPPHRHRACDGLPRLLLPAAR